MTLCCRGVTKKPYIVDSIVIPGAVLGIDVVHIPGLLRGRGVDLPHRRLV